MVLLFSWLQYKTSGKFVALLQKNTKTQPFFGALLGLTPGCGGAIIVMPLYIKKVVTFGTVIATLAATLGDAAFLLIAKAPNDAAVVHLVAFVTAVLWGMLIDKLQITHDQPLGRFSKNFQQLKTHAKKEVDPVSFIDSIEGEERNESLGYRITHQGYVLWWWVCLVGLILGVTLLVKASDPNYALELTFDPNHKDAIFNYVGLFGTLLSIILFIAGKHFIGDDTLEALRDKLTSSKETLIHAASETAFVTFWVLLAYLIYEYGMYFSNLDFAQMIVNSGPLSILFGDLVTHYILTTSCFIFFMGIGAWCYDQKLKKIKLFKVEYLLSCLSLFIILLPVMSFNFNESISFSLLMFFIITIAFNHLFFFF